MSSNRIFTPKCIKVEKNYGYEKAQSNLQPCMRELLPYQISKVVCLGCLFVIWQTITESTKEHKVAIFGRGLRACQHIKILLESTTIKPHFTGYVIQRCVTTDDIVIEVIHVVAVLRLVMLLPFCCIIYCWQPLSFLSFNDLQKFIKFSFEFLSAHAFLLFGHKHTHTHTHKNTHTKR